MICVIEKPETTEAPNTERPWTTGKPKTEGIAKYHTKYRNS